MPTVKKKIMDDQINTEEESKIPIENGKHILADFYKRPKTKPECI